jgi:peptidoglycan/xylan/chitin deacetylase (PgdA/CDA1 family)
VSHRVLSRLSREEQFKEIENSASYLENFLQSNSEFKSFCFPYGGDYSYNLFTLNILNELKFDFSFSVESRNLVTEDSTKNKYKLPRFDCNEFPFGSVDL